MLLEERKLDLKANWSLSCCQGDGVAFEGNLTRANVLEHCKGITPEILDAVEFESLDVKTKGHYTYKNSMTLFTHCDNRANSETIGLIENACLEFLQSLSMEFEKIGYSDIEHQTSDESLIELAQCNEMTFLANGQAFYI